MTKKTIKNIIQKRKTNKRISFIRLFSLVAIFLFVIGLCVYGVNAAIKKNDDANFLFSKNIKEKPQTIIKDIKSLETTNSLLKKIANHIALPDEEIITFAKVKDPKTLELQSSFYKGVQKGDYIVLYPSLAVIYNVEKDIIVNTLILK